MNASGSSSISGDGTLALFRLDGSTRDMVTVIFSDHPLQTKVIVSPCLLMSVMGAPKKISQRHGATILFSPVWSSHAFKMSISAGPLRYQVTLVSMNADTDDPLS